MTPTAGQTGAQDLLARFIASIPGEGVALDSVIGDASGVGAIVHTPAGDRYSIAIEWLGDREADR